MKILIEKDVLEQTLEALETLDCGDSYKTHNAATALREALKVTESNISDHKLAEQAVQEPVAWVDEDGFPWKYNLDGKDWVPLYAAPVRTKDLMDDEIMKINVDTASIVPTCDRQFHFARAVIAADREKNK